MIGPPIIGFVAGASNLVWGLTVVVAAIVLGTTRIRFGAAPVEAAQPELSQPAI